MKTYATKKSDIKRSWHLLDAQGQVLGRLATRAAQLLQGKFKVYFTPNLDCGDYVVIINSDQVEVTGRKPKQKIYYHHSQYPGGLKSISFEKQLRKDSRRIIEWAITNMLPKNKLRDRRLKRLKIFKTADHPYQDKFKHASKKEN
jgi:large subunit ribosomal protein L13